MPGTVVYTGGGIHPPYSPQHKRYYAITDAMCAEHDWFTTGTVSYKFVCDKISENFVEIYMKILNFGKLLKNYIIWTVYVPWLLKKNFRLDASPPPGSATDNGVLVQS